MNDIYHRDALFIDGQWSASAAGERIQVISPTTEQLIGHTPDANPTDMDRAVTAARRAFDKGPWPRMTPAERSAVLAKMAAYLRKHAVATTELIINEMGSPSSFMMPGKDAVPTIIDYYAELARTLPFEVKRSGAYGPSLVRYEPVGVVAAIAPWNGPLFIMTEKVAPALAAGCTIVAKPAPETPLDAYLLADAAAFAGLPPGVLNIVPAGRESGEALVRHPGVDKVSFTGSTLAGRRIAAICGEQIKRCSLELGGKSAAVALADASAEAVAQIAVGWGMGFNSGQACAAMTRVVVPRHRQAEIVAAMEALVKVLKVGDPMDPATVVGPLVAERQRDRVEGYIAAGKAGGAKVVIGGGRPAAMRRGWFVEPTLFCDGDNNMKIAREEIFGPVGVVIPYDGGDEEAIRIANDSDYGLAGSVFSADPARAFAAVKEIRAGTMGVNTWYVDYKNPFGGYKASGIGREMGPEGLSLFQEVKTVVGVRS